MQVLEEAQLVKKLVHRHGFEPRPSGLKSKCFKTIASIGSSTACKKIVHRHGFEPRLSGLKSKHLTTRPKKSELCDLRSEMRELSPGKKNSHVPITLAYRKCKYCAKSETHESNCVSLRRSMFEKSYHVAEHAISELLKGFASTKGIFGCFETFL